VNRLEEEARTVDRRDSDGSGDAGRAARHAVRLRALRRAAVLANDFLRQPANPGLVQPGSRETRCIPRDPVTDRCKQGRAPSGARPCRAHLTEQSTVQ